MQTAAFRAYPFLVQTEKNEMVIRGKSQAGEKGFAS
jgi:hypothetical protein